jgi:hypothetical protein
MTVKTDRGVWSATLTGRGLAGLVLLTGLALVARPAAAWVDLEDDFARDRPDGIHITDGSYVMNVGELEINITNHGLIGSWYSSNTTLSDAPSAQWPAGSGIEYLWSAGLWVGGVLLGERLVSTGQYQREFRPLDDLRDTIYEAIAGRITRPPGNDSAGGTRLPEAEPDDDEDGLIDEEILNGYDDDGDGRIDEDFGQIGNQMMVCTEYDNTRLAQEVYPDHTPLNLKVVQQSYAWENDLVDDFVGFEFFITNIGVTPINNVYIGFFADCDIGPRGQDGAAEDDMAGFWEGMVQASDGSFVPISVGFMYDASEGNRVEGYFGILFLGHDTDPTGQRAPRRVAIRSYQAFSGQASFDQGGDPTNDAERYELMSVMERDSDTPAGKQNDFRFMVSAGPFLEMEPDAMLQFQAAMVVGPGLEGLKKNCAEAALTFVGNFFNLDGNPDTGKYGRETKICLEDVGADQFDALRADFGDTSCVTEQIILDTPPIDQEDVFVDEDGKHCTYINSDNCFECGRQKGSFCTKEDDILSIWNCWNPDVSPDDKAGCTGVGGNEYQIHWLVGMAPPPPGLRLWPTDNAVYIYWDNRSEVTKDIRLDMIDFESYRIWRADNWDRPFGSSVDNGPQSNLWQLIAEYDLVNSFVQTRLIGTQQHVDTLPLGPNTGLEQIRYRPRVLDDPRFVGLAEEMQFVVDSDPQGLFATRPQIRNAFGEPVPGLEGLLPWEGYPAVLDTFWAVTYRARNDTLNIREKLAVQYYEYADRDIHNGFLYFYSVSATDHSMDFVGAQPRITGAGQSGDPGSSFTSTVPGTDAQTAEERKRQGVNIYVYPNPATRDALDDFQPFYPNGEDPTGVRVVFANLPMAKNKISIFTLDGDLVAEVEHDGRDGYGQASWNLMSRNGQEVVSGIYLYVVASEDNRFEDFIGKFVIVR